MASQVPKLLTSTSFTACGAPKWLSYCWRLLLLLVLLPHVAFSGQIVKYLPGFDGELPFKLETGYVSVGDSELFYYFIESQGDPQEDPIFLWLTGGPGCSSFSGIIYEIGPLEFDINRYKGGLPKLKYYPYAWTKTASFIFLDAPVGTGFSYSRTPQGWLTSDSESAEQSYQFLRQWLLEHPQYLLVQLFIGGDSYSGITVPLITQKVVEANEAMVYPYLNLKGYLLGSPATDQLLNANAKIIFAHRMALISDQLYEKLKTSCNDSYVDVDPSNTACVAALGTYEMCIKDLYTNDILEPSCVFASHRENPETVRRSAKENPKNFILSPPRIPELWCRNFNYVLAYVWSNNLEVQDALHVRKGAVSTWQRCNQTLSYTKDVQSVIDVHRYLSNKGLEVLVQNGDRDMVVPFVATQTWIKSLNLTISDEWRPWFVDGQVAGYTRKYVKYSQNATFYLTYATVKGGGHTAPEYYRRECYDMFQRWIHYYPL
ncbi:serine carboxypeptidase-like 18 [Hevea brasiliensis]|uniref:serine carboxypeptidase-like 18 n=1 Tax=Hevea brasiliensis TaxID=3981 RepID=UPI0025D7B4ED|nr:serine carboxypeptidase-like 18 [Hevea brasiliensis]